MTIEICQYNPRYDGEIYTLLYDEIFVDDERVSQWMDALANPRNTTAGYVALDTEDETGEQVIGCCIVTFGSPDYLAEYCDMPTEELTELVGEIEYGGICDSIVVKEEYRNQGIGTRLVRTQQEYLQSNGIDIAFTVTWDKQNGNTSRPLFEKQGFEILWEDTDYYENLDEDVPCTLCTGACSCGATALYKTF